MARAHVSCMSSSDVIASLPNMPPITPVFISIDPRRDTPTRLKEYKKTWDPKFLWLTGTNEQVWNGVG